MFCRRLYEVQLSLAVCCVTLLLLFNDTFGQRPVTSGFNEAHGKSDQIIGQTFEKHSVGLYSDTDSQLTTIVENKRRRNSGSLFPECAKNDLNCYKDSVNLDSIVMLHSLLDDDRNGNVDQSESDEFLRDELHYTDGYERHSLFHGGDKLISVDDLWRTWKQSSVYNWTIQDVVDWLVYHVELPQYTDIFIQHKVDGTQLPRLATNNQHYISDVLLIKNPVHKQKLSLKAMDAVLFGPPKKAHSYVYDLAVVTSLVIAIGGCWFAYYQHKHSKEHMKRMMKDMETLQKAEDALCDMQNKLEKAEREQLTVSQEKKHLEEKFREEIETAKVEAERLKVAREGSLEEMSRLKLAEEELKQVRSALKRAEKELELRQTIIPAELQPYLQLTHEIELLHYHEKRQAAEYQLIAAREECERIRKKRNTVIGALGIAHGKSMDEMDQRIAKARAALEEVRVTLQERLHRWASIEHLCGFSIVTNTGLASVCNRLQRNILPSGTIAYGLAGTSRPALSVPLVGAMSIDDTDEDLPPSYSCATVSNPVDVLKKIPHSSSTLSKRSMESKRLSLNNDPLTLGTLNSNPLTNSSASLNPASVNTNNNGMAESRVKFNLGENSIEDDGTSHSSQTNGTVHQVLDRRNGCENTTGRMSKSKSYFISPNQNEDIVENGGMVSHKSDPNLSRPRTNSVNSDSQSAKKSSTVRKDSLSSTDSKDSKENEKKKVNDEKKRRKFFSSFLKKEKNA